MFVLSARDDPSGFFEHLYSTGEVNNVTLFLVWIQKQKQSSAAVPEEGDSLFLLGPYVEIMKVRQAALHHWLHVQVEEVQLRPANATGYLIVRLIREHSG
jgi:hypothetical protein